MKKYTLLAGFAALCVPQVAQAEVIISPRVAYYFDNLNQRTSGVDEAASIPDEDIAASEAILQTIYGPDATLDYEVTGNGTQSNQLALPMFGLAATYVDDDLSVTLTGMYGETNGGFTSVSNAEQTVNALGFVIEDIFTSNSTGNVEAERYDVELTVQKRLNEKFAIMGGVRYEHVDTVANATLDISTTNSLSTFTTLNFGGPFDFGLTRVDSPTQAIGSYDVYSGRIGVAGFIPFGENGTVFLNGMLHVSHEPDQVLQLTTTDFATGNQVQLDSRQQSETTFGPDIAVGIELSLSDSASFDIRYRAAAYFPVSGPRTFDDPRVNHGINAGVSFRF